MENNEEIEKTLNSLQGLQKTEPGPFFYEKVRMKLERPQARVIRLAPRIVWQAAACLGALVVLNVFVWTRSGTDKIRPEENNPLAKEYFSYLNTPQF